MSMCTRIFPASKFRRSECCCCEPLTIRRYISYVSSANAITLMTYFAKIKQIFKYYEHIAQYRVYQNDWSGFEVDYIHKYGEQNYKY